jgi:hypothetical protein
MRLLQMDLLNGTRTQYIENDEEAEQLYAGLAKALAEYSAFRNAEGEIYELIVSDGTKQTIRLDKLCAVSLVTTDLPDWLKSFHVENERRRLEIMDRAKISIT